MVTQMRTSFFEGIKATIDPTIIPENSIWRGLNIKSDINGILRVRDGSELVLPSLGIGEIQGMISAFGDIIFVWDDYVYRYNNGNPIRIDTMPVTINPMDKVRMIKWTSYGKEVIYIFGNSMFEFDGETIKTVTPFEPESGKQPNMLKNDQASPHTAKYITLRASLSQRVAVAGVEGSPNTVYLSAPLDISYFPADQVIQLPDDGNVITGITNWYNALVIFRTNDIWAFFGTDLTDPSASLVLQDGAVGCMSPDTIVHVPEVGVAFVGPDNIYALQGVSGVENQARAVAIGDDVANFIRGAIKESKDSATATYFDGEYRVSFPEAIQDQRVFRLSTQQIRGWYTDTGPVSKEYLIHNEELYGSHLNMGAIHRITDKVAVDYFHESDPSASVGIPVTVVFRRENLQPGPARIKRIFLYLVAVGRRENTNLTHYGPMFNDNMFNTDNTERANIEIGTEQNLNISVIVDGNEFKIDEFKIRSKRMNHQFISKSEPVRIYEARIRPSLKGHFAQIKLETTKPGELIALMGYAVDYQPKGRIRGIREGVSNNKDW